MDGGPKSFSDLQLSEDKEPKKSTVAKSWSLERNRWARWDHSMRTRAPRKEGLKRGTKHHGMSLKSSKRGMINYKIHNSIPR